MSKILLVTVMFLGMGKNVWAAGSAQLPNSNPFTVSGEHTVAANELATDSINALYRDADQSASARCTALGFPSVIHLSYSDIKVQNWYGVVHFSVSEKVECDPYQ